MKIRWPLLVRRTHKWLAVIVGAQVVLWTLTGFYMVVVHIDYIHGDHLVRPAAAQSFELRQLVSPPEVISQNGRASELKLQRLLDRPVWRVESAGGPYLVDGASGRKLPPLSEAQVREVARRLFNGNNRIVASRLLSKAPLEVQTRKPPLWQVEFEGWNRPTFYISAATGELLSRRHALWRVFDFAWMLHIMDYEERSNVNNPLLRVATWSAVIMALSGGWLLLWSFPRRKRKKA